MVDFGIKNVNQVVRELVYLKEILNNNQLQY